MTLRLPNPVVPVLALLLTATGVALIAVASERMMIDCEVLQLRWLAVALAAGLVAFAVPYGTIIRHAPVIWLLLVASLVAILVVAPPINGSRRWLPLGGFRFQGSEFMKFGLVITLARVLRFERRMDRAAALLRPAAIVAIPAVLVLLEPNLSSALLYVPVGLAAVHAQGARRRHLAAVALLGALVAAVAVPLLLRPYQQERILSTFLTSRLPPSERAAAGWQLSRALEAVGSGGVAGRPVAEGEPSLSDRVPERHNDFILCVLGEKTGFLGTAAVLALLGAFGLAVLATARRTREPAGRLVACMVGVLFVTQVAVNAGVTLGLLPTTGIPLPFLSYGGASLILWWMLTGLVLNVSLRRPPVLARDAGAA